MNAPTLARQSTLWLAGLGSGMLLLAIAWWSVVFLRVIGNGYLSAGEALTCAVNGSIVCDLATSLCGRTHPLGISWYSPLLMWAAVALLSAAALILPARSEPG